MPPLLGGEQLENLPGHLRGHLLQQIGAVVGGHLVQDAGGLVLPQVLDQTLLGFRIRRLALCPGRPGIYRNNQRTRPESYKAQSLIDGNAILRKYL